MTRPSGDPSHLSFGERALIGRLTQIATDLNRRQSETDRFQHALRGAADLVSGCDHASISLQSGRSVTTAASSDEVVQQGDLLQYELREGPCMDAIDSAVVHVSANLAQDPRWPRWGPQAVQRWGIHSALAVPLVAQTRPYGSLNLFGDRADAYAEDAQAVAQALATQLALAMANAREIEQRGDAMANRTVIGQAEGMLMERLHLSSAQAFAYLRRVSQATNQKLVTVAADIVHTRRLPDADGSTGHRGDRAPR